MYNASKNARQDYVKLLYLAKNSKGYIRFFTMIKSDGALSIVQLCNKHYFYRFIWPMNSSSPRPVIRTRLRSALTTSLPVRRTRLSTVGDWAFPVPAARTWNDLQRHFTSASSLPVFRSRLKTLLFQRFFRNFCPVPAKWLLSLLTL